MTPGRNWRVAFCHKTLVILYCIKLGYLFQFSPHAALHHTTDSFHPSRPWEEQAVAEWRAGKQGCLLQSHPQPTVAQAETTPCLMGLFVWFLFILACFLLFFSSETVLSAVTDNQQAKWLGPAATLLPTCLMPPSLELVRAGQPCTNSHHHPATVGLVAILRRGRAWGVPCRWAKRVTPAPSCPGGAAAEMEGNEGVGAGMPRKWRRLGGSGGWGQEDWSHPAFGLPNLIYASPRQSWW